MIYINRFFFNIVNQVRKFYLNSNFYDKKISKVNLKDLIYKPSQHLLSSLLNYQKKQLNIQDVSINKKLLIQNKNKNDFKK